MPIRSLSDLLILLVDEAPEYCPSKTSLACFIPPEHKKNFDPENRSIIILGTKNVNPGMLKYNLTKELGHFVLQDVYPQTLKDFFGMKGDWKSMSERTVREYWMPLLQAPQTVEPKYREFIENKLADIETGTPEITYERLFEPLQIIHNSTLIGFTGFILIALILLSLSLLKKN